MIIQSTKKLQDMLGINATEVPSDIESFDSWHGNVFMIGRRKCLLLTHTDILYSVFIYGITKQTFKSLAELVRSRLQIQMTIDNFIDTHIEKMLDKIQDIRYMKSSNKTVMGSMNNMVQILQHYNMTEDEKFLNHRLNNAPYKILGYAYPSEMLKKVIDINCVGKIL